MLLSSIILSEPYAGRSVELAGGLEVWFGHFQSLQVAWKPFQKAFAMSGKVHEILDQMLKDGSVRNEQEFGRKIATLKVLAICNISTVRSQI